LYVPQNIKDLLSWPFKKNWPTLLQTAVENLVENQANWYICGFIILEFRIFIQRFFSPNLKNEWYKDVIIRNV
jgi:hypothetical protein